MALLGGRTPSSRRWCVQASRRFSRSSCFFSGRQGVVRRGSTDKPGAPPRRRAMGCVPGEAMHTARRAPLGDAACTVLRVVLLVAQKLMLWTHGRRTITGLAQLLSSPRSKHTEFSRCATTLLESLTASFCHSASLAAFVATPSTIWLGPYLCQSGERATPLRLTRGPCRVPAQSPPPGFPATS